MTAPVEYREFDCTIPAGTLKSAPITVQMAMPTRTVLGLHIRIPPGPNGLMGFQIGAAGQQIVPANSGVFLVMSDESVDWPVVNQINSGAWQLFGYNTGIYPHTVYVRFSLALVQVEAPTLFTPILNSALSSQ